MIKQPANNLNEMMFALQMKWSPYRTTTARPGRLLQTNKQSRLSSNTPRHPGLQTALNVSTEP